MQTPRPRIRRNDDGAAAVEFALVLPILLFLVFGIIDFGRAYNAQLSLTNGAREGVRVLALGGSVTDLDARLDPTVATSLVPGISGTVTVSSSQDCSTATDAMLELEQTFEFLTPLPGLPVLYGSSAWSTTTTLHGKAVMRCEA